MFQNFMYVNYETIELKMRKSIKYVHTCFCSMTEILIFVPDERGQQCRAHTRDQKFLGIVDIRVFTFI